ncbi:uncharacterized protein [Venturia canescens]|uniref:uncharacterized protein n=1 Tax=Venturia canescens TaxID=32260 RepID=UPI001C9C3142|nr:uncharacterized protein LOC122416143 [Venturia canescens]
MMEKPNRIVLSLLVLAIVGVHSASQSLDSSDASSTVAEQSDSFLGAAPVAQEGVRRRRTPGGSNDSDEKLTRIKAILRSYAVEPQVPPVETPDQRERRLAVGRLNRRINQLMQDQRLNWNVAVAQAYAENRAEFNQLDAQRRN